MNLKWPRGVTVSTLDSESSDSGSNPREAFFQKCVFSNNLHHASIFHYTSATGICSSPKCARKERNQMTPTTTHDDDGQQVLPLRFHGVHSTINDILGILPAPPQPFCRPTPFQNCHHWSTYTACPEKAGCRRHFFLLHVWGCCKCLLVLCGAIRMRGKEFPKRRFSKNAPWEARTPDLEVNSLTI